MIANQRDERQTGIVRLLHGLDFQGGAWSGAHSEYLKDSSRNGQH
jgi:hypothetical protein